MKKTVLLLLFCLALFGCKPSESEIINFGMNEVRSSAKNPEIVIFDTFYVSSGERSGHVCGTIVGKNLSDPYKYFYVHIEINNEDALRGDPVFIVNDKKSKENFDLICIR